MTNIKEFTPLDGENVLAQIEGDAWNDSPNPITQFIMMIMKLFWAIFGIKKRTYIIVSNLRVVQVDKETILWGILPGSVSVLTLNKSTIQSVGYAMASSWFIFRKYYFVLTNMSALLRITYKGSKENLIEACNMINKVVTQV